MTFDRLKVCLVLILVLGAGLRFAGATRGSSDFVPSGSARAGAASAFYHFHPDEVMVLQAALEPIDPLDPAFTVYGLLPVYVLRAALSATMPAESLGRAALDQADTARRAVVTARLLAAVFSCLVLVGTAYLTWRYADPMAACMATLFVAVAPGVIQQAHFYIVDGLFSLLSLAAIGALLRATEGHEERRGELTWYATAGLLIGATGAVKLTGLMLGLVLVFAHLRSRIWLGEDASREDPWPLRLRRALLCRELWLAGGVAAVVLAMLEPYLVGDPYLIFRNEKIEDFAASAAIARGEVLRLWTLADVHTVPYIHHWAHLLPLIAGWPLTIAFIAGIAHALWRRSSAGLTALVWMGLYFALIGGLHAKHVRYLVPLVPLLALLVADLLSRLCRLQPMSGWRLFGPLTAAALAGHTVAYGLAFTTIYTAEDSRIRAARWIHDNVLAGQSIAAESGGFSLAPLISQERHEVVRLHESRCFGARNYLTCRAALDLLRRQLARSDYVVIADANRHLQFTAVPDIMPVTAEFYRRLPSGEMGFDLAAQFANPPRLAGIDFSTERPETSFIGYDHPTVYVLRRRGDFDEVWDTWWSELQEGPQCPDRSLAAALDMVQSGDLSAALSQARAVGREYPDVLLTSFLEAYIRMAQGGGEGEQEALERYEAGYADRSHTAFMIPWASAMSLIGLGGCDLVTSVMAYGHRRIDAKHGGSLADLAIEVGNELSECGEASHVDEVDRLATEASPTASAYLALGIARHGRGDLPGSAGAYARALELDGSLVAARVNLAWNLYLQGELEQAIELNRQILERGPHHTATCNLALAYLVRGEVAAAEALYTQVVAAIGAGGVRMIGAMDDLRGLAQRGPHAEAADRILARYWPEPRTGAGTSNRGRHQRVEER